MGRGSLRLVVAVAASAAVSGQFAPMSGHAYAPPELNRHSPTAVPRQDRSQSAASLEMPVTFERHLGDLNAMVKRHRIRALVVPSRSGFFYDKGHPQGIFYEAMEEFQRYANLKLKTGSVKITVTYIPVRPEQLEHALLEGVGDVIAYGVIVTPEREKVVLFTTPIDSHVTQVIVTGPKAPPVATLEDLSGKEVYVNPLTVYSENLQTLNASLEKAGKPPILVKSADPNITD